jgi:hypothetical protein
MPVNLAEALASVMIAGNQGHEREVRDLAEFILTWHASDEDKRKLTEILRGPVGVTEMARMGTILTALLVHHHIEKREARLN